jgi:hypothetical protein
MTSASAIACSPLKPIEARGAERGQRQMAGADSPVIYGHAELFPPGTFGVQCSAPATLQLNPF